MILGNANILSSSMLNRRGGFIEHMKTFFSALWYKVSDDEMIDIVSGNNLILSESLFTSYIPGDYSGTITAPDISSLKTADVAHVLYSYLGTPKNLSVNDLVSIDTPRVPVKYDSSSPYSIKMIGLFDPDKYDLLSDSDKIIISNYLDLWVFYWGSWFDAGSVSKENRVFSTSDYDGNIYYGVPILTKNWLTSNLKTTHFNNGDAIPYVENDADWAALTTPAYCYPNGDASLVEEFGLLYNWYAVNDSRGISPDGYKVPEYADFTSIGVSGGSLKNKYEFASPNTGATDLYGFNSRPVTYRYSTGLYSPVNHNFHVVWTNTSTSTTDARSEYTIYSSSTLFGQSGSKKNGYSVRCIKI